MNHLNSRAKRADLAAAMLGIRVVRNLKPALALCLALPWISSVEADTVTYSTAGTTNWVCPPGVTSIQVECWGGGGAGGGASKTGTANVGGGGGGGGAYAKAAAVPVTPGNTYVITIPAAVTCPSSFVNDARYTGAAVTFSGDSGVVVTAAGGTGGQCKVATTTTLTGTFGAGGTAGASVGDTIFAGGSGSTNTSSNGGAGGAGASDLAAGNNANASSSTAGTTTTGSDANHNGGAGGAGRTAENAGNAGTAPGGGGGGGKVTTATTTKIGGAGGLGRMILTYTVLPNVKANNTDNLNLASSWTVGVPIGNPAKWDNTVTSANTTSLGGDLTVSGIQIADPAGPITINSGNILTIGSAAIDLDLSAATQDLTLNCDVAMGAANVWDAASGRTLTLGGIVSGTATVTKQGVGAAILSGTNTYSGATTVSAGTLVYDTGSTFSPGGNGGVSGKLTVNGASAVATLAGSYTATGNGDAYYEIKGGGVLNFNGTANLSGSAGIRIGEGSAGTMNMTGGTLTANMNSSSNLVIGRSAGGNGTLNLSGSTLTLANGGGIAIANTAGNAGVVNISGTGQLVINSSGSVIMGAGTATLNLDTGGTFTLGAALTTSGTSTINFNGGTLKAGRSSTTFLPTTLSGVNILAGGAIIDTNGNSVTIPGALLSGVAGDGGLTKIGLNALTLAGTNTYSGTTNVSAGTLKLSTAGSSASDVVVASGAGGGVSVVTVDAQLITVADFSYGNGSTLVIDYGTTAPSISVAPLKVDNLTLGSGLSLRFEGDLVPTLAVGQAYPLISWTANGPANGSAFTGLILPNRLTGTCSVSLNTLYFTVTANTAGAISWNTGDGVWDTVTSNWLDALAFSTTYMNTLDDVLLGDATGASGNPTVTLNSNISPQSVRMNSSNHDYTITGTGSITGILGLTLDAANTRTLTLTTTNTYTGPTAIVGGTLSLGNGGAGGSLNPASAISVASGAIFAVNQSDPVTQGTEFSGAAISGAGGFTQAGGGTTVLNAANTYSGPTEVSGGMLRATVNTTGKGMGTGTVSIGSGSTLLLDNTNTVSGSTVTVSNTVTGTGLLRLQFGADTNPRNLQMPNVSGFNGTIQLSSLGVTGDKWNALGVGTTAASLIVDAGNTLYVPSGTPAFSGGLSLNGAGNTEGRGAIRLSNGTLGGNISLAGDSTINLDNAAAVLTGNISSGAAGTQTLTLGATASTGGTLSGVIGGGMGTLNVVTAISGTYTLTNANTYTGGTTISAGTLRLGDGTSGNDGSITNTSGVTDNGTLTFNRFGSSTAAYAISGTGGVSKTGTGTQTLSGTNSYTGSTIVNNGTLVIAGTTNTGSGILQVGITTGASTLTVATGGSFTTTGAFTFGSGLTGHTLNVQNGASLSVGSMSNAWGSDYHVDGTLSSTGAWVVSTNQTTKVFDGAGTISAAALTLGNASTGVNYTGTGTIHITNAVTVASNGANGAASYTQTSGMLNAGSILLGDNQSNTAGSRTFNLSGGRVNLGSGGIASSGTTTATRAVNLGAGTLGASADWSSSLAMTLTGATTGTTVNTRDSVDNTTARTITLSGNLSGTGALTKAGVGTLTLTGTNTYTGATTVAAGTLALVGGSQTSPITVSSGASLEFALASTTSSTSSYDLTTGTVKIIGTPTLASYTLTTSAGITGTPMLDAPLAGYALTVDGTTLKLVQSGTTYSLWAALNGLDDSDAAHSSAKNADPDGDGHNNLYEFAFDGNPRKGVNDGKIAGKVATVSSAKVMTLTLPVRTGATFSVSSGDQLSALIDGIYYRIEGDEALSPFADAITEVPDGAELTAIQADLPALSSGWTYRTFCAPDTVPTVPKAFLRAKVSETP